MNTLIKYSALALIVMLAGYNEVMADPVNINITGKVVASPCNVDNTNSNLDVNLGNIQATDLAVAGAGSALVPFQLKLKDCPVGTTNAIVTFGGTESTAAPGRYISTGTATNVAVELVQSSTGYLKGPGTTITQAVQADRTVTYNLKTRAYAAGMAAPGTINATIQATFTYN